MKLNKIELKIIEVFVVLLSGIIGTWLCMEKYFTIGILTCLAGIFAVIASSLYRRHRAANESIKSGTTLGDMWAGKKDNECALWDYGEYGYSAVPCSDTWKEWISSGNGKYGLVVTVNRPDLDYYNFGDEFYFVDLKTNKKISIPTGNRARNEKVGNLFHNGMVVRLMPKTT